MRKRSGRPKPLETQVYKLQIGFDAEGRRMLDELAAHRRMTAAATIRDLITEAYRRMKLGGADKLLIIAALILAGSGIDLMSSY